MTAKEPLSDLEREVLEHVERGPVPLAPLLVRHPRETLYRATRELKARGLASSSRGRWSITPAGREALDRDMEREALEAVPDERSACAAPALAVPHLALAPSEVHRAVLELAILAASVRRHRKRHHASLVLASGPLRGKSWTLEAACLALGADPATSVLHAGAETSGSLKGRRNAKGEVLALRAALASPVLALDEWLRGSTEVRRAAQLLLHGVRELPLEDEKFTVRSVVMLACNPPEGSKELEARTGLDRAMIRRALVADLDGVTLDEAFRRDGEARLERLRELGPVTLPDPVARDDDQDVRDRAAAILDEVLDGAERVALVDVVLVAQLVQDARAFGLALEGALALVLRDACTLWETTAWTRPDWRDRLTGLLPARPENVTLTADVNAVTPAIPPAPDDAAYDYEARLHTLERVARAHGASDPDALDTTLATATALRDAGVHVRREDARGIAELLRVVRGVHADAQDRLRLLAALDELRVRAADAERVLRAVLAAEEVLGLAPEGVVLLAQELARLRFDPCETAAWVVSVIARHGSLERELADHERVVREREHDRLELARDVAWLDQRLRTLVHVVRRAEKDPSLKAALKIADAEGDKGALAQIVKLVEVRRKGPAGRQDASA